MAVGLPELPSEMVNSQTMSSDAMTSIIGADGGHEDQVESWKITLRKLGPKTKVQNLLQRKRPRPESSLPCQLSLSAASRDSSSQESSSSSSMALPPAVVTPSKSSKLTSQSSAGSTRRNRIPQLIDGKKSSWTKMAITTAAPKTLVPIAAAGTDDEGGNTSGSSPSSAQKVRRTPAAPKRRAASLSSSTCEAKDAVVGSTEEPEVTDEASTVSPPRRIRVRRLPDTIVRGNTSSAMSDVLSRSASGAFSCSMSSSFTRNYSRYGSRKRGDRRLRVAIFNACPPGQAVHPAAVSCLAALIDTPWFHSHAVEWLLGDILAAGGTSTVWTPPVVVEILNSDDIRACRLTRGPAPQGVEVTEGDSEPPYHILVVPGGSAAADSQALGSMGLDAIKCFVKQGGCYLGICAGAFLALSYEDSAGSLGLVNATASMRDGSVRTSVLTGLPEETVGTPSIYMGNEHEEQTEAERVSSSLFQPSFTPVKQAVTSKLQQLRRRQDDATASSPAAATAATLEKLSLPQEIDLRFTARGRKHLWDEGRVANEEPLEREGGIVRVRYSNGPLMNISPSSDAQILATAAPCDMDPRLSEQLPRTSVILMEDVGDGRAVLISPHPESTQSHFGIGSGRSQPGRARLRRILQRALLIAAAGPTRRRWLEEASHVPVWCKAPDMPPDKPAKTLAPLIDKH